MKELRECPSNLTVSKSDLYTEFQRTDFALSISSTGALEAMLIGIPTYFIRDFCGETNQYGSSDFNISGNVVDFETVINRKLPEVNFTKADSIMRFDGQNTQRLTDAILSLATSPPRWIRSRKVKLHLQYSTNPILEPIRQRLKHTHQRNPELIAAWMNQNIRRVGSTSKSDLTLNLWNNKNLQLEDPSNSTHSNASETTPATETIQIHGFFASNTLLNLFPQKHANDGQILVWERTDLELLEKWFQLLIIWSANKSNLVSLLEYWKKQDLLSGEISFYLDNEQTSQLSISQRTSFPNFHVSPALRLYLEHLRATHETLLDGVYNLLDKVAWYDRYFETIARNWPV